MAETMTVHVLDQISYTPDLPSLMKRLHIKKGSTEAGELCHLVDEAAGVARPRALYLAAYVTGRGDDWVEIEGFHFHSRVLKVNLEGAYRVFPYLATCGMELQEWAAGIDDMLLKFWAEAVKENALVHARHALSDAMEQRYQLKGLASMNPGSLQDWPIQQQRVLFDLFGSQEDRIGVRLTDSMLMLPTKSVSGICFPTEVAFESCQLCPREDCPGRRAPYDPDLYQARFGQPA